MSKIMNIPRRLPKSEREEEPERPELNRNERNKLWELLAMNGVQNAASDVLRKRMQMQPRAWSMWQSGMALQNKALVETMKSVPTWQFVALHDDVMHSVVAVRYARVVEEKADFYVVNREDENMLFTIAIESHCRMCLKTEAQIKQCALRKTLTRIQPPDAIPKHGCGYSKMAAEVDWGEYGYEI